MPKPRKLLLADDSVAIRRVIELTFAAEGIDVLTVVDGQEAIARIPVERPDVVLVDVGMPTRSGYEVSAFVKGHPDLAHIPVLLLAGAFEPVDAARARMAHCDGVLIKPFDPQHLVARVRELMGRHQRVARPSSHARGPDAERAPAVEGGLGSFNDTRVVTHVERSAGQRPRGGRAGAPDSDSPSPRATDDEASAPTLDDLLWIGSSSPAPASSASDAGWTSTTAASSPAPTFGDGMVEEVTRRVIERLSAGSSAHVGARGRSAVSEAAERVAREEIQRIHQTGRR